MIRVSVQKQLKVLQLCIGDKTEFHMHVGQKGMVALSLIPFSKGEKEAWYRLYLGVVIANVNCIVQSPLDEDVWLYIEQ